MMLSPVELSDDDLKKARRLMTPRQRRKLARRERGLFRLLTSDDKFFAMQDAYARAAFARCHVAIARVTRTVGPDYRVEVTPGHWIRANASQYAQAKEAGIPHKIIETAAAPINNADRTMQRTLKIA